jgi:CheY-like chemotaxis protein
VPAGTEPAQTTDPPTSGPGRHQAADILVLDDSLLNQTLLRSMLEPHGYHVRTAFTVEQAITAAEDALPDLVLSDVHVGRQSGAQLLSHVRRVPVLAVVPFAFITATADWQDPLLDGCTTRIIRRPIEPAALLDEVETLLNHRTGG